MQPQRSEFDPTQLPPRIASKIEVDENGCWVWTGARSAAGYGCTSEHGRVILAHRFVYERLAGPIPVGLTLDHLCRNRPCVNPSHLEPVTLAENILRGEAPTAVNARKTHCPKGHPLVLGNLCAGPRRKCLTCHRERERARYVPKPPRERKTHCGNGHEYTPENTRLKKDGTRVCKTCHRNAATERYHRLHPDAPYLKKSVPSVG